MTTQWDDDRIRASAKERTNRSPVTGLPEVGFVVQLFDLGPPGERSPKPRLLFDSESAHGTAGVFGDQHEALAFCERRHAAELRCQREIEAERHRRKEQLSERQRDLWAEEHRQKEIAKAARKAALEADEQARKLAEEAASPEISIACNPSEDGWSLWVAPCWTDGTQEGDPRQLVIEGSGMLGPRRLVGSDDPPRRGLDPKAVLAAYDDEASNTPEARPPRDKRKRKRTVSVRVPDSKGRPIGVGSLVQFSVDDGPDRKGQVMAIGGRGEGSVEIEDDEGKPWDAMASECTLVDGDEQASDWPDPEAA